MWRICGLVLCLALGSADEVILATGEVIDGEVLSEDADTVRIRIVQGGMKAERSWPRSQVVRIVHGESPRQRDLAAARTDAAALAADAPAAAWTGLALRARRLADNGLARTWAERACAIDRNQADAQHLLGRDLVNGVWMRPYEAAASRGEVWEDGRWMPWPEREHLRAEAQARTERMRAEFAAAAERRRAAAAAAAINASDDWPIRLTVPNTRVIWWGGWQPQLPICPTPYPIIQIGGSGRWGGIDWNLRVNW